jgi:hypothetical protein
VSASVRAALASVNIDAVEHLGADVQVRAPQSHSDLARKIHEVIVELKSLRAEVADLKRERDTATALRQAHAQEVDRIRSSIFGHLSESESMPQSLPTAAFATSLIDDD